MFGVVGFDWAAIGFAAKRAGIRCVEQPFVAHSAADGEFCAAIGGVVFGVVIGLSVAPPCANGEVVAHVAIYGGGGVESSVLPCAFDACFVGAAVLGGQAVCG